MFLVKSFVPNGGANLTFIKGSLNTNIALLTGYNTEDYVSLNVHNIQVCSHTLSACCHQVLALFLEMLTFLSSNEGEKWLN